MEGMADRDDLRFRLDWPEDDLQRSDDQLSDFSFEWDEAGSDASLAQAGEPEPEPFVTPVEPAAEPVGADVPEVAEAAEEQDIYEVSDEYAAPPLGDADSTMEAVRAALSQQNTVLMQLSDAMYELASNVRALVDAVEAELGRSQLDVGPGVGGDVAASAMVTMGTEVTGAIEKLTAELNDTKADLRGLMDDLVAAASGHGPGSGGASRVAVELGRVQNELQALKRRIPVRAKELDATEIADIVSDAVLLALSGEAPAPRKKAAPAKPASAKRSRPLRAE
jgi:hypothetical protein